MSEEKKATKKDAKKAPPTPTIVNVVTTDGDPLVAKYERAIKEEEIFTYFIQANRAKGQTGDTIITAWKTIKDTFTDNNLDLYLLEYKLKSLVGGNRASMMTYNPADVVKMMDMAVERVKNS